MTSLRVGQKGPQQVEVFVETDLNKDWSCTSSEQGGAGLTAGLD